jgi:exonuclease III
MKLRLVSWNIGRRIAAWNELANNPELDVALLQEASAPPAGLNFNIVAGAEWTTLSGWGKLPFCAAIAQCSKRFEVVAYPQVRPFGEASGAELVVSRPGSIAVATVAADGLVDPIVVVSIYSAWERPVPYDEKGWIYADASAHRLISDLSALVSTQSKHRIIVAGDWNILHGYGENGSPYWGQRYQTVFDRMKALGFEYSGPKQPNGYAADPRPIELPDRLVHIDIPTFRTRPTKPASGQRQLDFVFVSRSIADAISVRALNGPDEWGPSDHCRIEIQVDV